ncbi:MULTISPECIES: polyprenol monophosphomannose synthase [Clostridium]|uniref:polyprenol monophosphomannose synthase n=1 Tax=Clostridium TaxID=1485 RepID=UPI000824FED1|nr:MULTISPECIES: polyprenol monophosphomannose synthase [Clostridium]PJI06714.1 polyprenol monophosphomannose synthase [Clostridium sp. CT7]
MLSIVIPVYNEKDNVSELVLRIEKALGSSEHEIIFVDDSNDETTNIIKDLTLKYKNVILKHRENKRGLSSAVIYGFKVARGDIISVMDGDLQHPPEVLKNMLDEINNGADIVVPSRFIKGGSDGGLNIFRKLVSFTARYIGKLFLKKLRKVSDPTGGLFMVRRYVIENRDLRPIGWKILIEILVMGNYKNFVEIPYSFKSRSLGSSKLTIAIQLQYLKQIVSLIVRSRKCNIK